MDFSVVERSAEEATGLTVAEIRRMSPDKLRRHIEARNHRPMSFASAYPLIGRGSVLRDFISREELNRDIDAILKAG
ncbi:hypothetical protein FACS1894107_15010 [Planctomycetales bacterium]|nr:hypothetical protein FACS1894107_15010 [Planctomycetales bacterium]GHT00242.1 hypothetical protein FACS1894108_11850 [Planctomycetales bacterium]